MNKIKQLPHFISEKALKMSTYRNLVLALLSAVFWISTIATSFAYTNTDTLGTFNYIARQSPVENIAPKQLILQEPINIQADASSWTDESQVQQSPLSGIIQAFQEAWKQPNIEQTLFNVCRSSEVDTSICLDLLKAEIKTKRQKLIEDCYTTPGINGRLCLDQALKQLGVTLSDFDRWINELEHIGH